LEVSEKKRIKTYNSVVPNLFDAFLPLLILELFIPPLWNFHFSPVRVRRLLTTIGTMVFIDDNNLIMKRDKNCLSTKTCDSTQNNLQIYEVVALTERANVNLKKKYNTYNE